MRARILLLLPFLLAACAPPRADGGATQGAGERTKVVVYSPHGREMLEPFEQRFEAAQPEYDLEWLDMGSQEVLDRLRAERANPAADLWWGAPHTMFAKAAEDGLLAPYQPTWHEAVADEQHDPNDLWYGQYLTPAVIVYNSEALEPDQAPHDWDELLEPQWTGKILIRNPLESGTMRTFFAAMILRQPTVEAGFEWLAKLDAQTKAYPANPALLHRQMATQEGVVTVWALRDVEIQKRVNHYPLAYHIPASGCPTVLDGIALVKDSPHPDAAKVLYEFVTAPEQLIWSANEFDTMPARADIDPADLPDRMPRDLPVMELDWSAVEAHVGDWMDRWDRTVRTDK